MFAGGRVIMACRDMKKCQEVLTEIVEQTRNRNIHCRHVDLSSLESIRTFAQKFNESKSWKLLSAMETIVCHGNYCLPWKLLSAMETIVCHGNYCLPWKLLPAYY